jgi:hypothetical protein
VRNVSPRTPRSRFARTRTRTRTRTPPGRSAQGHPPGARRRAPPPPGTGCEDQAAAS